MYRSCSRCGKIHSDKQECNVKRLCEIAAQRDKEKKLRSRYAWTKKSHQIREDSQYLCDVCREQGRYTYEGVEVHHIEKLRDRPDLLLDDDNLICLCAEHHKQADRGELDIDYLRGLAQRRNG